MSSLEESVLDIFSIFADLISYELEQHERHEARASELDQARLEGEARELLIGILGHDLRTPISAIRLSSEILLTNPTPEEISTTAEAIRSSADRMERMTRDLLQFTKVRLGGGMTIQPRPVSAALVCSEAVNEISRAWPDRSIEIDVSGDLTPLWDKDKIVQLLSNLLSNALQYSPSDTAVRLSCRRQGDAMLLSISNEGAMPEEDVEDLFEPFRRSTADDHPRGGLGLGLYIVSKIVEAHGGSISVDVSESTTFHCTIPIEPPANQNPILN